MAASESVLGEGEAERRTYPRVLPAGDSAVVIELGSEIDPKINSQIFVLAE